VVLKSESGCLSLSCGDGRMGRMTLEAASEALDRQVTVAGRRARRGRRRVFLPSSSHGNLLLLLPCPVLMCNRGVRHGQPLTRATGPLSPMGTGSNVVGQVTGWACWAVHAESLPSLHEVLPGPYLLNLTRFSAAHWHGQRQPTSNPGNLQTLSPVSWLASRSTAFPSSHKLCDRGFGLFCWEWRMEE
jgi:hypothetical protein